MSEFSAFVRTLPSAWATCPIYAKGVKLPKGGEACGKSPLGKTHHEDWSAAETALYIERHPDEFKAVGVFTGPRSQGLVILDIDANLAQLKKKWGTDLDAAPVIKSPRKNAAKYLFYVPREYWGEVDGLSLSGTNEGWEVLWGRQGLVGGSYKDKGVYTQEGDFQAVPEAPEWLLAYMKESYKGKQKADEGKRDPRYGMRSKEELYLIAKSCLSVIQPQGRGSEDQWWRIGAMIHSELPSEQGLDLWREWSKRDDEYADDWEKDDPCADRWESGFKASGGLGFGSLIAMADHYDPDRKRFLNDAAVKQIVDEISQTPLLFSRSVLPFEQVMEKARTYLEMDNPAEMNYNLNNLALQAGYRDQLALEKLIVDQIQFEGSKSLMGAQDLIDLDEERNYLIPDVLPHPSVVLLYGAGGDGKSMAAWTLAKHVASGEPFVVRGKHVPVKKGPVLLLNGDQPLVQLKEQLQEVDYPLESETFIQTDWSLQRYAQFVKQMNSLQPKLVVIDSLIGCSGGRAFDENKSDFATPLYWLTRNNGILFPATTIIIIHHANKQGGFRGTSAIRDAVDETWALKKPSKEQVEKGSAPAHSRLVTIEKSRSGRSGTSLLMQMEADLSFSISDFTPEVDAGNTAPSSITDRVLQRLRVIHPRTATRSDLNSDPVIGGNVAAIRKSLHRLEKRGLIEVVDAVPNKSGGKPTHHYKAVLACGGLQESVSMKQTPSAGTDEQRDTATEKAKVSHFPEPIAALAEGNGTASEESGACPITKPSDCKGFSEMGQSEQYPRAREDGERTEDELNASRNNAWKMWD
ncbi:AAA family ATPase [Limnobacter sp.]|uniref:AAA family ATPase n=1 Tax=Limnobacter sp. TaxID=2003368 RepID=UPI00344C42B7